MLDIDFCLDSSLSAEDSWEENPFALDFSGSDGTVNAELVSPPSSEDERDTDDEMSAEEDASSSSSSNGDSVMIQPAVGGDESGWNLPLSAGVDNKFDALPAIVLDFDDEAAALPFEFDMHSDLLLKTPSSSSQEHASVSIEVSFDKDISRETNSTANSLVAAKKKLDECMLRTEETRRWIKKYVKKPCLVSSSAKVEETTSSNVVPVPFTSSKKKKIVPAKVHKKSKKTNISNKRLASQLIRETSIRLRGQERSSYECSGVVLHRSVSLTSNDSSDSLASTKSASSSSRTTIKPAVSLSSSKPSSISDFLRRSRKSASMSIYN